MSRLALIASVSLLGACVESELDYAAVEQEAGKCPSWMCGPGDNSPEIDHMGLHELNVDGAANAEGFSITSVTKAGTQYKLLVEKAEVKLAHPVTGVVLLSGNAVIGTEIIVKHVGGTTYKIRIDDKGSAAYWAKPSGAVKTTATYFVNWIQTAGGAGGGTYEWKNICSNPPSDTSGAGAMNSFHVVLFESDRIDARRKTVYAQGSRWFNIGCATHALAKLHLVGHTQGAQNQTANDANRFVTTLGERQTFLKMITADYCGVGDAFTVAGQPLEYADAKGWLKLPNPGIALEARWNENGAVCLNTPRIDKNPTPAGIAEFGGKVEQEIAATCKRPPPCTGNATEFQKQPWISANP